MKSYRLLLLLGIFSFASPVYACDCQTVACDISCGCLNNCIMRLKEYLGLRDQQEKNTPVKQQEVCEPDKTPECKAPEKEKTQ